MTHALTQTMRAAVITIGLTMCGGSVYAHIAYDRQVQLKGEIIRETLGRIGRLPLSQAPIVMPSPERGYRMRARLHAQGPQLGFLREGTHQLCDAASTGQLSLPLLNTCALANCRNPPGHRCSSIWCTM